MKSRKGISPILATLLLIVIAVAAISVTYAWIMTYMGNTTDKAGVTLNIANTNFASGTPKNITIDIINSGTTNAQIASVYVGQGSDSNMTLFTPTFNGAYTNAVNQNAMTSFNVTITGGWTSATMYYFKVVPTSGNALMFNERAP